MSLFNIFKKKSNIQSSDSLSLEELLKKAANEPAYRAEFYKRLLSDELFVITQNSGLPQGNQDLQQGTKVKIVSLQDGKIPVFTSQQRIFDKGVIKEQVEYMRMTGKNLFDLAKGATFLLNPYSDYGKEFPPDEVEQILRGELPGSKTIIVEKKTEAQIGQPAKYPTESVNALKILFANKSNVKAAYLGWIYVPDWGQPPHYIFGIETDSDFENISNEAGFTAKQYLAKDEIIDIVRIEGKEWIVNYLKSTEPFYKR